MRILYFSNVYPGPTNPGAGTFNRSLLEALNRKHRVRAVVPVSWLSRLRARLSGSRFTSQNGANSLPLLPETSWPTFYYPPRLGRRWYGQWMWWSTRGALLDAAREFRPQAVLSYWAHPDGDVAVRLARRLGIPAVVMTGGSDMLLLTRNRARRKAIRRVVREADAVIAVSRDIALHVVDQGVPADRVHVVYRGVDREVFSPGNRDEARGRLGIAPGLPTLVAVGRLVSVKGYAVLLEACRQLLAGGLQFACYVLGEGPQRRELERQIALCGLEGTVRLPGRQSQQQLADWYRAANLTVLPSLSEGVPNVLLECMAAGGRFVASRVGGVPEIADARCDRLVPAGDPAALAAGIAGSLVDVAVSEQSLATGRSFVPPDWEKSADDVAGVLAGVCGPALSSCQHDAALVVPDNTVEEHRLETVSVSHGDSP